MIPTERFRRRDLPHWDVPHAAYFITTCLEGSIPAQGLLDLQQYRTDLERRPRPADKSEAEWEVDRWKLSFARVDRWLDEQPAARHLGDPRLAKIVVDALYYFAGQRYDLLAFVVMPSHIHWVFQPLEPWVSGLQPSRRAHTPRERIVHSVNRYSAAECNKVRGVQGVFWQHESYDHWVRSAEELERIILYIEANPVKAGLVRQPCEWLFSSAFDRVQAGVECGCALVRPRPDRQVGNLPPQS